MPRDKAGLMKIRLVLTALLLLVQSASAWASPWYDELLFELRWEDELKEYRQPAPNHAQATLAYSLWQANAGLYTLLGIHGGLSSHRSFPDATILRGSWQEYDGGERRTKIDVLGYSLNPETSRLHIFQRFEEKTGDGWKEAGEQKLNSETFSLLALTLLYCRYPHQPNQIQEVLKQARASSRLSVDEEPFELPPAEPAEPPEGVSKILNAADREYYLAGQLQKVQALKTNGEISDAELQILETGLQRAK